jgi:hypothetical protein
MNPKLAKSTLDVSNDNEPEIGGINDGYRKQRWGQNQQI